MQNSGDELKLVYPQDEAEAQPAVFEGLSFDVFSLQPLDDDARELNTAKAVRFCLQNPHWRLSLQTHKILDID